VRGLQGLQVRPQVLQVRAAAVHHGRLHRRAPLLHEGTALGQPRCGHPHSVAGPLGGLLCDCLWHGERRPICEGGWMDVRPTHRELPLLGDLDQQHWQPLQHQLQGVGKVFDGPSHHARGMRPRLHAETLLDREQAACKSRQGLRDPAIRCRQCPDDVIWLVRGLHAAQV